VKAAGGSLPLFLLGSGPRRRGENTKKPLSGTENGLSIPKNKIVETPEMPLTNL